MLIKFLNTKSYLPKLQSNKTTFVKLHFAFEPNRFKAPPTAAYVNCNNFWICKIMFDSNIQYYIKIPYVHNCVEFRHRNIIKCLTLKWLQVWPLGHILAQCVRYYTFLLIQFGNQFQMSKIYQGNLPLKED